MRLLGVEADRHHRDQRRLGERVELQQVGADGAAAHREHHVVQRGAGGLADGAEPLDRPVLGGEPSRAGDLLVEQRARGVEGQRRGLVAEPLVERLDQGAGHADRLGGDAERAAQRGHRDLGEVEVRRGLLAARAGGGTPGGGHVALVGVGGQDALEQPHRRDAVDQGVVELGVLGDAAVAQPLDDVGLPQRPLPRQAGRVQPAAEVEQLAHAARLGQGAVAEVVLDVELVVLLPHQLAGGADGAVRVLEVERPHLLDVTHRLVHLAGVAAARALRLLEQLQTAHVHRHVAVLGEQERRRGRIDRCGHRTPSGRRGWLAILPRGDGRHNPSRRGTRRSHPATSSPQPAPTRPLSTARPSRPAAVAPPP